MRLETRVQSRRRRHADFSKLSITHAMSERSNNSDWPARSCATVAAAAVVAGASTACRRRLPFKASLAAIISAVQRQPRDCHRKPHGPSSSTGSGPDSAATVAHRLNATVAAAAVCCLLHPRPAPFASRRLAHFWLINSKILNVFGDFWLRLPWQI